ncbi:hypothetical protein ACFPU1_10780 [Thalassorhabdus alkalitolerans]|uniref:Uncharacterized protein n=1 Tax=Thalassorhabdus alkalitolerans TaxID=2282697 RepID=A0ABW0YRD2_9BACI|nr:hypothetical protein [Thalassobacillus sp. C254]
MEKETYYVALDQAMLGLYNVKTDENTIQYEVRVTPDERKELEDLLSTLKDHDVEPHQIGQPFHETKADNEKKEFQERDAKLYQKIYDYGTEETKQVIGELREDIIKK